MLFTKKVCLNWYSSMIFFRKIRMIFDIVNSLWKSKIGTFALFDKLSPDGDSKSGNFIWLQLILGQKTFLLRTHKACYAKSKYSLSSMVIYLRSFCLVRKKKGGFVRENNFWKWMQTKLFFCVKDFSNYLIRVAKLNLHSILTYTFKHEAIMGRSKKPSILFWEGQRWKVPAF